MRTLIYIASLLVTIGLGVTSTFMVITAGLAVESKGAMPYDSFWRMIIGLGLFVIASLTGIIAAHTYRSKYEREHDGEEFVVERSDGLEN